MLHFKKYGSGPKAILAFHGFGGNHTDWEVFLPALEGEYTLYSFDLWHHGKSDYQGKPIEKIDFENLINTFCAENKIYRFSLFGYSLGGRICLQIIEIFPGKIDTIWLFAPDGLHRNILYRFATRTIVGNILFKNIIDNPSFFFNATAFFSKLGIVHAKINTFIHVQLGTKENRNRVYRSWRTTSRLWPDLKILAENIDRYKLDFTIFMGKHDKLVQTKWAKNLTRLMLTNSATVRVLDAGHNLQTEKSRIEVWGK